MDTKNTWKLSSYLGAAVDFAPVLPEDDYLHPIAADAHYSTVETYLCGFNIPAQDINCNIYILWHHVLKTVSMHVFVYRGKKNLPHQLAADYFVDQQFMPVGGGDREFEFAMGSCTARMKIVSPLDEMQIDIDDPQKKFALRLNYRAALPPVGRPGGHHFTQLMKTSGSLKLDGRDYTIDGFYMRDRSWGYQRPEQPERTPPYRWMTGWFNEPPDQGRGLIRPPRGPSQSWDGPAIDLRANTAFVVAWIDTGMLDGEEFGPNWDRVIAGDDATGKNKWESGGPTPSLNLRSGWFAVNGTPRPVVRMDVRTLFADNSRLLVKGIELEIEDADGGVHHVSGETQSVIPKMYWQTMLTYMHCMNLRCGDLSGNGDLMDTYSTYHIRRFGL